jgi:hypothetical protein
VFNPIAFQSAAGFWHRAEAAKRRPTETQTQREINENFIFDLQFADEFR